MQYKKIFKGKLHELGRKTAIAENPPENQCMSVSFPARLQKQNYSLDVKSKVIERGK